MVPMERAKSFHDFCCGKVKHALIDLELFAISIYRRKLHFYNCNVDSTMNLIALHLN